MIIVSSHSLTWFKYSISHNLDKRHFPCTYLRIRTLVSLANILQLTMEPKWWNDYQEHPLCQTPLAWDQQYATHIYFFLNCCRPEVLQLTIPKNVYPSPSLEKIVHPDHVSFTPVHAPSHPFVKHNKVGNPRRCMPIIISYPKGQWSNWRGTAVEQTNASMGFAIIKRERANNGSQRRCYTCQTRYNSSKSSKTAIR